MQQLTESLFGSDAGIFPMSDVDRSVPTCFESGVARWSDRIAIADETGDVTYQELNRRANQIGRWIRECFPKDTGAIGLLLEHGTPAIIGLLAALKSCRIYVPLDPTVSAKINRPIVADAEISLILTDNQNVRAATEMASAQLRVFNIDTIESEMPGEDLGLRIGPEAPAAIYYTSGSTGQPKGVVHMHAFLIHNARSFTNVTGGRADDRFLLSFPVNANPFMRSWSGAADWITTQTPTIVYTVPTAFRQLAGSLPQTVQFPSVRIVKMTGEPLFDRDVDEIGRRFPEAITIWNDYGATEAGGYRRILLDRSTRSQPGTVPVGYAVEGKEVLLWDDDGNEVALGEVGEVVVKSRYLALGYWKRPDLTAKVFLDGGGNTDDVRFYRTGDLGRLAPDGCLELHGRMDDQVKIRGNRVELSAVESAMNSLDGIEEAAVIAREDQRGHLRLEAYLVGREGSAKPSTVRANLAMTLPRFMIPSAIFRLDQLPRSRFGKVDRRALLSLAEDRRNQSVQHVAPRDSVELKLQAIVEALLRVTPIGIDDDIIERGADSLTAVELVIAIERELGVRLPVEMIFAGAQTVALLAQRIRDARDGGVRYDAADARQAPRVGYAVEMSTISLRDLTEPMLLLVLCVADLVVPGRHRRMLMRAVARLLAILRPRRVRAVIEGIGHVLGERRIGLSHRALAIETQANFLERRLLRLRGWSRGSAAPPVSLEGAAHIDDACRRGNGVILWGASLVMAGMATSVALNERGYAMSMLVRPEHGFTRTKFGHLFLNRLSRENTGSLEAERIVITGDGQAALDLVRRRLAENRIVWIGAQHQTDNPAVVPFFSGHLDLATGPPRLALATEAALLPVFTVREPDGSCRVVIEPPFTVEDTHPSSAAAHTLLPDFVAMLETYVLRDPASWKGWLSRVR